MMEEGKKSKKDARALNYEEQSQKTTAPHVEVQTQESAEPDNDKWAADAQDELENWIEEQGIQLRY